MNRCQYIQEHRLFETLKEKTLDFYVKKLILKKLKRMNKLDLGNSLFYNNIFYWDEFKKGKGDHLGQPF